MICSARDFSSSGLSGAVSSATRSPFTRMVAGRPTFSRRSEPLRCTMCVIACLKLNCGRLLCVASPMRIHPEKDLAELHRLCVLCADFPNDAPDFGLDLVHDLHGFDDAARLPDVHPGADLHVRLRGRLRRLVERPHHGGLDLEELGACGRRFPGPHSPGSRDLGLGNGRCLRHHHMATGGVPHVARLRNPHGRPRPKQTAPDLHGPHLGRIFQDLHDLGDDVELHTVKIPPKRPYTSSRSSVAPSVSSTGPSADRCTSSSIRTPPRPATYTPGSIVTTAPSGSRSAAVRASRGASCTSRPTPCPVECPNAAPNPRASIGSRANASASRPVMPARTPSRARRCASCTNPYSARCDSSARAPTTTVRVTSAQYPSTTAPKSSSSQSPAATVRVLVCACGSALRGPLATMVGNGCASLP